MSVNVIECHKILLYSVNVKEFKNSLSHTYSCVCSRKIVGAFFERKNNGQNNILSCLRSKVATWDGKSKINKIARCRKCNKKVIYDIENQETRLEKLPERQSSSGVVFI